MAMENMTETTKLLVSDRCDVCGAQAYMRVQLAGGELLFCAHHGNANKAKLEPITLEWHDQSSDLKKA